MVCRADNNKGKQKMKKLMIALAVVAMGAAANAASFSWKAEKGYVYDGGGDSAVKLTSGTAYLVFASALTQSDLVTAFAADAATAASTVSTKAVSTGTIGSNSRIAETAFTADVSADQTAYFVVFNDDKMYVSITADAEYLAVGESPIAFASVSTSSKALNDVAGGYAGAGWYGAAAVPEPTSGLLMLLGMAGLALKRKRA